MSNIEVYKRAVLEMFTLFKEESLPDVCLQLAKPFWNRVWVLEEWSQTMDALIQDGLVERINGDYRLTAKGKSQVFTS